MLMKILDYGEQKPFGETLGRPYNLAWPVNAYRVTLPFFNYVGLNIFERVILKIIDACGIREAAALARETCIPEDLVKFILFRMKDMAYINENNEIIKDRRDKWMKKTETSFYTTLLFRELATGKILPFLHFFNNSTPLVTKELEKFQSVKYNEIHMNKKPDIQDVNFAFNAMNKHFQNHLNNVSQIRIAADEPEFYYLDCPIAIQKSDGNFRIADPFGYGFSYILESSFSSLLEQNENLADWYKGYNERLRNKKPANQAETEKQPFDNNENWGRYPELVYNLRFMEDMQYRTILQIYSSIEWALFYSCIYNQHYTTVLNELNFTDNEKHSNLLINAAEEIGLELPRNNNLYPVLKGKIDDFLNENAEYPTIMSIALLIAANDFSHPLRGIAAKYPDLISRINKIKEKRDKQGHGKSKFLIIEKELPDDAFMREFVTALIPDIHFSITSASSEDEKKEHTADIIHNARVNICCEFGFKNYNLLGADLQDILIHAEYFWLLFGYEDNNDENKLFDIKNFTFILYAAIQAMFKRKLSEAPHPDFNDNDSELIECAKTNAEKAGFGELPAYLCDVKPFRIRHTLRGNDLTLGACAVAFLIVSDINTLKIIFQNQPSFFTFVADINELRGHGNKPVKKKKKEIDDLRKSAYLTIKTLLEV